MRDELAIRMNEMNGTRRAAKNHLTPANVIKLIRNYILLVQFRSTNANQMCLSVSKVSIQSATFESWRTFVRTIDDDIR